VVLLHTQAIPIAASLLVLEVELVLVWSIDGSGGCGCGGNGSFIGSACSGSGCSDSAGNASGTDSSVQIVACKASVDSKVTSHKPNFINQQGYALEISALTQTIIGGGTLNSY
jgi:hypothetical protein